MLAHKTSSLPYALPTRLHDYTNFHRTTSYAYSLPGLRTLATQPGYASRASWTVAESVGESRTRVVLAELGYIPELQVSIVVQGKQIARVDVYLRSITTVVEFDGKIKYGRLVPLDSTPQEVVWREKLREDGIREGGLQMVRLTWADLSSPEDIRERIKAAARRAAASPPPTAETH